MIEQIKRLLAAEPEIGDLITKVAHRYGMYVNAYSISFHESDISIQGDYKHNLVAKYSGPASFVVEKNGGMVRGFLKIGDLNIDVVFS